MTTLTSESIERIIGRFEKSIASHRDHITSIDFSAILREILTDKTREEPYLYAGVVLDDLPVGQSPETIAQALQEYLDEADVLLWGRARVLWHRTHHDGTIPSGATKGVSPS